MTLTQRSIGAAGQQVSAIGLGCMPASWGYRLEPQDDATSIATIERALALGVTHLDTAAVYGPEHNERLVGAALRGRREGVLVASKAGLYVDERLTVQRDARPESLVAGCEASLRRLAIDVIDLFYLHRVDPAVPVEESWGALAELVTAGKVRSIGLSECSVDELARAHAIHPVAALQSEMSLWTRDALDGGQLAWCAANGVAFVAFGVLGRGYLTGALPPGVVFPERDFRRTNPRFTPAAMEANRVHVDAVAAVALERGARPSQVLIAWALAQGPQVLAIPGTKRAAYVEEHVAGDGLVLSSADLARLDALPPALGNRYA